jgi:ATP adenylyltransferase/5',5'''-P-1,P-4-tetraphosphate phosphorylase II
MIAVRAASRRPESVRSVAFFNSGNARGSSKNHNAFAA